MASSLGLDGMSSSFQEIRERVSWRLLQKVFQITSVGEDWFLKTLLFRSFQIVQKRSHRMRSHRVLRSALEKGVMGQLRRWWIKYSVGFLFWQQKHTFSQRVLARLQEIFRCWADSVLWLQLGHRDGPMNPLLIKLSQVRNLLWLRSQRNVETLGHVPGAQTCCQIGSRGLEEARMRV